MFMPYLSSEKNVYVAMGVCVCLYVCVKLSMNNPRQVSYVDYMGY